MPSKTALVILKVGAALVSATGGAIALFGEPRLNAALTPWGYIALGCIFVGLCVSTGIELVQARLERHDERVAELEQRASREWTVVARQVVTSVAVSFHHRWEMSVSEFMGYLGGIIIRIAPDMHLDPLVTTRSLRFERVSQESDLEAAYALTASTRNGRVATSDGLSLYRAATDEETTPSSGSSSPEREGHPPNPQSANEPRLRTATSHVEAVTMIVGGGVWGYTTSNKEKWIDEKLQVCGVHASLKWSDLELGENYRTISELGRLRHVRVVLPDGFELRCVDEFHLTFFGSGGYVHSLDLDAFRFAQRDEDGRWEAGVTGPELYSHMLADFVSERTKNLADATDRRA